MKKIRVKLIRSGINQKKRVKQTLKSLGLNRIGKIREYNYNDALKGMLNKVKHLIEQEEIK